MIVGLTNYWESDGSVRGMEQVWADAYEEIRKEALRQFCLTVKVPEFKVKTGEESMAGKYVAGGESGIMKALSEKLAPGRKVRSIQINCTMGSIVTATVEVLVEAGDLPLIEQLAGGAEVKVVEKDPSDHKLIREGACAGPRGPKGERGPRGVKSEPKYRVGQFIRWVGAVCGPGEGAIEEVLPPDAHTNYWSYRVQATKCFDTDLTRYKWRILEMDITEAFPLPETALMTPNEVRGMLQEHRCQMDQLADAVLPTAIAGTPIVWVDNVSNTPTWAPAEEADKVIAAREDNVHAFDRGGAALVPDKSDNEHLVFDEVTGGYRVPTEFTDYLTGNVKTAEESAATEKKAPKSDPFHNKQRAW